LLPWRGPNPENPEILEENGVPSKLRQKQRGFHERFDSCVAPAKLRLQIGVVEALSRTGATHPRTNDTAAPLRYQLALTQHSHHCAMPTQPSDLSHQRTTHTHACTHAPCATKRPPSARMHRGAESAEGEGVPHTQHCLHLRH
jgi:hypothetical protein